MLLIALMLPVVAQVQPKSLRPKLQLSLEDKIFLEDLSQRMFRYFWEQADPHTGLVLDRARTNATAYSSGVASIAATGFGLTALCIAAEHGWITPAQARERARVTLNFLAERMPHKHGWFYHFVNSANGAREWHCEVSSIDTALLLAGVLTIRSYFHSDIKIAQMAKKIYERVDFVWMLNNHPLLFSHGWKPESGFITYRWDSYSELTLLYLLAIGSPKHPIPSNSWYAWKRNWITYGNYRYLSNGDPLFTHQYSHAWVDYRNRREQLPPYTDYFKNSIIATRAHRAFCLELAKEFPNYSENIWGITASDSIKGYLGWGGPPRHAEIDGTVVPCAAGGSLMFTPDISLPALQAMRNKFGEQIYGRYGFVDAFNPNTGWVNPDVIGIDVGIMLLSAENLRSGKVWQWFMRNKEIGQALRKVRLLPYRQ
ncbi:MAG: glucoamylase family protein [Acidobacteriota bacterium]